VQINTLSVTPITTEKKMTSFSSNGGPVYKEVTKGTTAPKSILKNGSKDLKTNWGKAGDKVELEDVEILSRVEPNDMEGI
jgi:hypothetical protein